MAKKLPKRDANLPIASWSIGDTTYEIRYTGPNEFCQAIYNPKHSWGGKTPSLIITSHGPNGCKDEELDPYNPGFWGWMVRLITDGSMDRTNWKALSKTDSDLLHDSMVD